MYTYLYHWETGIPDLLGASILHNVDRTLKFNKRQITLELIKLTIIQRCPASLAGCNRQQFLWSCDGRIFIDPTGHGVVIETKTATPCGAHVVSLEPLDNVEGMSTMSTGQAETGRTWQCKIHMSGGATVSF